MAIVYTDDIHYKNIAKSIRAKNGETKTYLPSEMPDAIDEIFTGIDTSDATSIESDILVGKTAYVNDVKITGTMVNNGAIQENINADESYTIPAGYHNGSGVVKATSLSTQTEATATETDIKSGQTAWVNGKKIFGTHICEGLDSMTADANAVSDDLLINKTAYVDGSKITGTMPNNEPVTKTLMAGENFIIPKGYHDGTGIVDATSLESQTVADASENDIMHGKTAWVNGVKITGTMSDINIDEILPTLTNPGVESDLRSGKQLIDASGNIVNGSIESISSSDVIVNENIVSIPAGIYDSDVSKSVDIVEQAIPSISVDDNGLITASTSQSSGYVYSGIKNSTKQLVTKGATTITPSASNQTIASGTYLTGIQTILGDANLKEENIKSGVSIFGVTGSLVAEDGNVNLPTLTNPGTYYDLVYGKQLIDENGNVVTGTLSNAEEAKFGV